MSRDALTDTVEVVLCAPAKLRGKREPAGRTITATLQELEHLAEAGAITIDRDRIRTVAASFKDVDLEEENATLQQRLDAAQASIEAMTAERDTALATVAQLEADLAAASVTPPDSETAAEEPPAPDDPAPQDPPAPKTLSKSSRAKKA